MVSPVARRNGLTAIDLFCGAGGLTEGFQQAGYEIVFAIDRDSDACTSYERNHRGVSLECASITDISPKDIARAAGGRVDVAVGGPSCQGFSTAGRKNGWVRAGDERNRLWRHMLSIVDELRPRAFLIENVPGLVYWKKNRFGRRILGAFEELGYSVSSEILLAADYGVPQRRRRVFLAGILGAEPFSFPQPTHLGGWRRDSLDRWEAERKKRNLLRHLACWEAIGDLPSISTGPGAKSQEYPEVRLTPYARLMRAGSKRVNDHVVNPLSEDHLALVHRVPPGGTWRDIPPYRLPDRFRGMRRTDSTNLLGRLAPELPAYTVTTQFNNVTTGCFTHPYEDRALSVREGARLQSFPDRYKFAGSITSRYKQVGNAVPPMLASAIAGALTSHIEGAGRVARRRIVRPAAQLPPPPASAKTRQRLSQQRKRDTQPERFVRAALRRRGLTFETNVRPVADLRRSADVVFPRDRIAVFIDGCFWHGCPDHARKTKSHTKWWADKIKANRRRDSDTTSRLEASGWTVVRVWEHEDPKSATDRVVGVLADRRRVARASRGRRKPPADKAAHVS